MFSFPSLKSLLRFTKNQCFIELKASFPDMTPYLFSKLVPYQVIFPKLSWSNQCICLACSNFFEALQALHRIGQKIENDVIKTITHDDIQSYLICPESKSKQEIFDCLFSHRYKHCFLHTTKSNSCLKCNHTCNSRLSDIMTSILQKDRPGLVIRVGRHVSEGKTKLFISPTHKKSEMKLQLAVDFISSKFKLNGLHNFTTKQDIRMTRFFSEKDNFLSKNVLYIGKLLF